MLIQEIGQRGVIFSYDDNISVYLIKGDHQFVLCDTHLGPLSMDIIKNYLCSQSVPKELLIFNSHSDWDHIWGNCAFEGAKIIGHEQSRTRMREIGEFELSNLKKFHNGNIELKYPTLTFSEKLVLEDEDIEFLYAPGHTIDSSLCFDRRDSVLFVGDLVEFPIPYLDYFDLGAYIKTLDLIRDFPAAIKLSAHSGIVNDELIERNRSYVQEIQLGQLVSPQIIESSTEVHQYNINNHLLLEFEPLIREKLGDNFDYAAYKLNFLNLGKVTSADFKAALENYLKQECILEIR